MDTFAEITGSAMETRVETPPPPKVHIVMRTMWICNGSKRQNDANLLHWDPPWFIDGTVIIFVFPSPRPLPCINKLYKEGAGRWKHENDNKNSGKWQWLTDPQSLGTVFGDVVIHAHV